MCTDARGCKLLVHSLKNRLGRRDVDRLNRLENRNESLSDAVENKHDVIV